MNENHLKLKFVQDSANVGDTADSENLPNRVHCIASYTGTLDRKRRVLFPGIWDNTLDYFLQNGSIFYEHDRSAQIGIPHSASVTGNSLYLSWDYMDTDAAREAKSILVQRNKKNKNTFMSNGYFPDYKLFEDGTQLLAYAENGGWDMSLFDVDAIKDVEWLLAVVSLDNDAFVESSQTAIPAVKQSIVTGIDSFSLDDLASRNIELVTKSSNAELDTFVSKERRRRLLSQTLLNQ